MSSLLPVAYVRNLSGSYVTCSCICALIIGAAVYMWCM